MAQYVVLKDFKDKYTDKLYKKGTTIEMTVKRADEAIRNLKEHDGVFLKRVEEDEVE